MSPTNCEQVRDVLPEVISGRLDEIALASVRAHLDICADCRAELAVAQSVASARRAVPAGLEQRVQRAAAYRRVSHWSRGRMAAAATFAVAIIGASVLIAPYLETSPPEPGAAAVMPAEQGGAGFISVEEAFGSGAASLRDLTEDELKQLLAELES